MTLFLRKSIVITKTPRVFVIRCCAWRALHTRAKENPEDFPRRIHAVYSSREPCPLGTRGQTEYNLASIEYIKNTLQVDYIHHNKDGVRYQVKNKIEFTARAQSARAPSYYSFI